MDEPRFPWVEVSQSEIERVRKMGERLRQSLASMSYAALSREIEQERQAMEELREKWGGSQVDER